VNRRADIERLLPWALALLAVIIWVGPMQWVSGVVPQISDIPTYQGAYDQMVAGNLPYLDFSLEYPPGAAAIFWAAGVLPVSYGMGFSFLMMVALVLTVIPVTLTARALGLGLWRQAAAGGITAFIPLLLGGLVGTRFDLALAALIAWMLWAVVTDRMTAAWVLLALAVLVKLIPLAFIPVLLIVHVRRHGGRDAMRSALIGLAVLLVVAAPVAILAPEGLWDSVAYHLDRPLQLESTGAAYLMGIRLLADVPLAVETSFGSQGLAGGAPDLLALVSTIVLVVLVLAIALTVLRLLAVQPPSADSAIFVAGIAATSIALLVGGKVLSPQFLVWIIPSAVLIGGRFGWPSAWVAALAMLLTQAYFPRAYWHLVALQQPEMGLLVLRDAVLIILLALVWPRRGMEAPLRDETRGQARGRPTTNPQR
jgi:Glycosyltransferase family 87